MLQSIHHIAYVVTDLDEAVRLFSETFGLTLGDRLLMEGKGRVEIATFRCGETWIELMRPIDHKELLAFLQDRGPGLHHVAYAVKDLPATVATLRNRGLDLGEPFVVPTGWNIAYFDLEGNSPSLFHQSHHGDHLVQG